MLALQLREDRAAYEAKARELTGKFATVGREELIKVSEMHGTCKVLLLEVDKMCVSKV